MSGVYMLIFVSQWRKFGEIDTIHLFTLAMMGIVEKTTKTIAKTMTTNIETIATTSKGGYTLQFLA
jgi:hypothetical protein